jgi:hypothetical protein
MVNGTRDVGSVHGDGIPTAYKVWVFGSKLLGIALFAVGIEMLTRGALAWAGLLMVGGAGLVILPVRPPEEWEASLPWRREG